MDEPRHHTPDWMDDAAYAPLLDVERSGLAWEWLRRSDAYRRAAGEVGASAGAWLRQPDTRAAPWGLHAFENPALDALTARPVWRSDWMPFVLAGVGRGAAAGPDTITLEQFGSLSTLVTGADAEHLLLSNGRRSIRIDLCGAGLLDGPVLPRWELTGLASADPALLVLRRLIALIRHGRFSHQLHRPERRARSLLLSLRTHDALQAGASQHEIAQTLLGAGAGQRRWRVESSSLRSQAQRLVRGARAMAAGRWAMLLR